MFFLVYGAVVTVLAGAIVFNVRGAADWFYFWSERFIAHWFGGYSYRLLRICAVPFLVAGLVWTCTGIAQIT
ncbi:hypothetical protein H3146_13630 [Streptomyces sp. OF3]|uniref:Uncharacterized protein n=1 Tax=Streptomyces alkaliterrae TaxID=2213162 RepID=A0A7W3ZNA9_9ACTN|nr:hypothetical protein [Streptomyces alkaliterrae]MBB1254395.1 hypothetical protein [Streptomyces alkaliterrae]